MAADWAEESNVCHDDRERLKDEDERKRSGRSRSPLSWSGVGIAEVWKRDLVLDIVLFTPGATDDPAQVQQVYQYILEVEKGNARVFVGT